MRGSTSRRRVTRIAAYILVLIVTAFLAAIALLAPPASGCRGTAACFTGTVANIVDGDTLDVGSTRIRLALVNTPEAGQPRYQEAKNFTASFCPMGSTGLVDEDDGQTGGSYGRMLAVVYCHGQNLNAALLDAGLAVVLTQYCSVSEFASDPWATACR